MAELLTVVGRVTAAAPAAGDFTELTVALDDDHTMIVVVTRDTAHDGEARAGDRVAVRGSVITRGDGPHPVSLTAIRVAVAAPGATGAIDDNKLCALVDDDPAVRQGAQAPEVDVPRPPPKRNAGDVVRVGRAPYYRTGAVLAAGAALVGGAAAASWGDLAVMRTTPPSGWVGAALVFSMFGFVAAAALGAGRVPFELGTGRRGGSTGRPAWAVSLALIALGVVLAFPAGLYVLEPRRSTLVFLAAACWFCAAAATAFFAFDAWKMRRHYRFAWKLLRGSGVTGVVDTGGLERKVAYQHKKRTYETTRRDKDGNTQFVNKTERWIEGYESTDGAGHLAIRTEDGPLELQVEQLEWSAPVRYLPGTTTSEVTSLTVIRSGDEVIVSDDRRLAFAAPGRATVTLFALASGHLWRMLALVAVAGFSSYLALRFGALA